MYDFLLPFYYNFCALLGTQFSVQHDQPQDESFIFNRRKMSFQLPLFKLLGFCQDRREADCLP